MPRAASSRNADARRFFDYFLIASGERSPADLRARIVAEIEVRLAPEAAAAADHASRPLSRVP